jgi:hypothetical protein
MKLSKREKEMIMGIIVIFFSTAIIAWTIIGLLHG